MRSALTLAAVTLLILPLPSMADIVLDVNQFGGCCHQYWITPYQQVAQQFPIHTTGLLAGIEFIVDPIGPFTEPLTVGIYNGLPPTNGSSIISDPLATITIPPASRIPEQVYNLLPFGIAVTAGDILSMVFSSNESTENLRINGWLSGGASGLFTREPLSPYSQYNSWQGNAVGTPGGPTLMYRTYVEVVPEPSTAFLLATGVTVLMAWRRLRC